MWDNKKTCVYFSKEICENGNARTSSTKYNDYVLVLETGLYNNLT